jgi:polyhydroxyalkanoate synthesis regulator phasin
MNNLTDLPQLLENGLRFTLGAGTALVDSLQDTQKRETTLNRLQTDFSGLSQEWVDRGTQTEQEARQFVETLLASSGIPNFNAPASTATVTTTATPVPHSLQDDLKELTAQVIALREILEENLPPTP